MSQELTDAEWLRYQVATVDDPPNQPPEGSECIYLTNEFVARMRSIAAKLERPAVAEDWNITRERLVSAAMSWGLPSDKVDAFVEDAKKSLARLWAEMVAADPDRFTTPDTIHPV